MISEPHRNLRADPQRWGAESVVTVIAHRGRTVTFQVRPSSQHPTSKSAFSNLSRVASFRSQRRLAQRRNGELRVTSLLAFSPMFLWHPRARGCIIACSFEV